ncbi:MAG: septation protein A [Rhodothalassiaceae bacterium]
MAEKKPAEQNAGVPAKAWIKLAVEMGPLLIFFGTYIFAPRFGADDAIYPATGAFMVAMTAALIASWRLEGKIAPMLWVSGGLVLVMGGLTLILADKTFIYMKPTLTNGLFASALLGGVIFRTPVMKLLFQAAFPPISQKGWLTLSRNWGLYFLFLAVLNEIMWRNFSEEIWVYYKTWAILPLTIAFAASQYPVMTRHYAEGEASG